MNKKWLSRVAKIFLEARKNNDLGLPIIVEGKRDKRLLLDLGFSGPIEIINRGWSLEKSTIYFIEKYQYFEKKRKPLFSILMDWDRTGEDLQNKLLNILNSMDKRVDETLRKGLIRNLNGRTKTVEGIRFILDELLIYMHSNN